ncbi:probable serine/threonine-protein kinase PBL23 [Gastrolobium bilobum]|uniref:probable serine/threonine-protein kinase PBL23 n=1 Tax=Gastrolobium bilobum TaxID=150636 RepID=UPI002AB0CD9C|nr:probable serine/threonine-protein kinase PBL23 [Gastrolobium bilobum]
MFDGYQHLVKASPPARAQSPLKYRSVSSRMLVGFIAGISTVMAVALVYYLCRRKVIPFLKKPNKTLKGKRYNSLKYDKILLRHFDFEELVRATKNFSQECFLGSGAFGNVYKGNFDLEGTLAIKRSHSESFLSIEEFRNEVRLLSAVKHRNLIGLVGYCEEPDRDGSKILVYEYAPNGSLLEYMMGNRRRSLTWKQRVKIAIGAARGIAYLHEGVKPSIIHRDIKPSNILIGEGFEAKVSDFGLVKSGPTGDQSHVSSQVKGTPGYLDPAYCSSFHLTKFSDVYSFGVILLQLVSARPVVNNTENQSKQHIIDWARPSLEKGNVEEIIDANLLCLSKPCNMKVMLKMGQLGLRCVVQEPKHRPTMSQVCQELEQALYSVDSFNSKRSSKGLLRSIGSSKQSADSETQGSGEHNNCSESFVSIDGVGFETFHIDMDSFSFQSTNLMCLENNSVSIDTDKNNLRIQEDDTK